MCLRGGSVSRFLKICLQFSAVSLHLCLELCHCMLFERLVLAVVGAPLNLRLCIVFEEMRP